MKYILAISIALLITACQTIQDKGDYKNITIENKDVDILNYGMNNALDNKLSGEIYKWKSSQSDLITTIIPLNTYTSNSKKCRDFIEVINVTGVDNTNILSYGIKSACRSPDLPWVLREN